MGAVRRLGHLRVYDIGEGGMRGRGGGEAELRWHCMDRKGADDMCLG